MTLLAGRAVLDILAPCLDSAVTVCFRLDMAICAEHPFLVVDIGCAAVFAGIFWINTTAMTKRAGLCLITLDKLMPLDEADIDAADDRNLYMAVATGCMAAVACFRENLLVKDLSFGSGHAPVDAVLKSCCCIVEGIFVVFGDFAVTAAADRQIVRRAFDHTLVGRDFIERFLIALMAGRATCGKMRVFCNYFLIDNEPLVILVRRNWRRLPCSALAFTFERRDKGDKHLHPGVIRVTGDATALPCGKSCCAECAHQQ